MKLLRRLFSRQAAGAVGERVGIRTGHVVTEVGASAILHALFSTICVQLENGRWGSRFPHVTGSLYRGRLAHEQCRAALEELRQIRTELAGVPVDAIVWDADDRSRRQHPAYRPNPNATSAADYFLTVNGRDLLTDGLIDSVESAVECGDDVRIVTFSGPDDFFRDSR